MPNGCVETALDHWHLGAMRQQTFLTAHTCMSVPCGEGRAKHWWAVNIGGKQNGRGGIAHLLHGR
jgi:hypothetical protein